MRYILVRNLDGAVQVSSLVEDNEAISIVSSHRKTHEVFLSIAEIENSQQVACPLYFDIDSSDLEEAYEITLDIHDMLTSDFQVDPYVFFSGSKGFHILMPFEIRHPRCTEIARKIAFEYSDKIDSAVYSRRQLWRVNGSIHAKTRRYKILLPPKRVSLEECINLSEQNISYDRAYKHIDNELFNTFVEEKTEELVERKIVLNNAISSTREDPPCLIRMFNLKDGPPTGERHAFLNTFIRHLRLKGYTQDGVCAVLESHPFWKSYPKGKYLPIIRTIFNYQSVGFGCKSGMGLTLRKYCHESCSSFLLVNGFG
jgi:hypothetical protein